MIESRRAWTWLRFASLCTLAAIAGARSLAHADLERRDHRLGPGLTLTTLGGYPRSTTTGHTNISLGLSLRNEGPERSVRFASTGDVRWERQVRVARGETTKLFVHVPAVLFQDMSGAPVLVADGGSPARKLLSIDAGYEDATHDVIGRIGELSTPMNVADPWRFVGGVDAHFPDGWRALAGIRLLVTELHQLEAHPERLDVLAEWLSAGGILVVTAPAEQIDAAPATLVPGAFASSVETRAYGRLQRIGFGALVLSVPDQLFEVGPDLLTRLELDTLSGWHDRADDANDEDKSTHAFAARRLHGVSGTPSWTLFGVQLGFALLVGPIGYRMWITRRRRPFGYVAFAGVTSLVFSLGMLAADLLDSGLKPIVNVASAVLVDQRTGLELGASDTVAYAPVGSGSELRAPASSELIVRSSQVTMDEAFQLGWEESEQWLRGAVTARTLRTFGNRWVGETHGRLVVAKDGDRLQVENHFGTALLDLSVWHGGLRYHAQRLEAGQSLRLEGHEPDAKADAAVGPEPTGDVTRALRRLWLQVGAGELGDHYHARRASAPAAAARIAGSTRLLGEQEHLIAGVL